MTILNSETIYDDDFDTCYETFVTLRIYTKEKNPQLITKILSIEPSSITLKGEGRKNNYVNGWFLSSKNFINSKDLRRHIDWIIEAIKNKKKYITNFLDEGFDIDIICYWSSKNGTGGPILSPKQLTSLSKLNIEICFEFYNC